MNKIATICKNRALVQEAKFEKKNKELLKNEINE